MKDGASDFEEKAMHLLPMHNLKIRWKGGRGMVQIMGAPSKYSKGPRTFHIRDTTSKIF